MKTTLEDVCTHVVDCKNRTAPIDPDGEFFAVGTPAMRGNVINFAEARRINAETFAEWTQRLTPHPGDILFAREAPVGPVVEIPEGGNIAAGQRTMLLRTDPTKADSIFLRLYLSAPATQIRILSLAHGSTTPHLRVADVRSFEVNLPPIHEQRAIAEVLGALDDKIVANTKLIATADEYGVSLVAQASSEGTFYNLSDLAIVRSGYSFKSNDWLEAGIPVVKIGNVKPGRVDVEGCSFVSEEVALQASNFRLREKEILIAMTGYVGEVARHRGHSHVLLNQRVGRFVVTDHSRVSSDYLYNYLRLPHVKAQFVSKGQGSAQQNIGAKEILSVQIGIPDPDELGTITTTLAALDDHIGLLIDESKGLGGMRDALLPQLMSGKLRVKDAQALSAAAV